MRNLSAADAALLAGIAGLGVGMVLVIAGVVVPGLFVPGTWLIVAAFLALAAAGALRAIAPVPPAGETDGPAGPAHS